MIDASSGGLMAILDIAWRIHMYSLGKKSFVVVIDEPENHLHPSMQRSLLRRLIESFPAAQFVVATHSPFMVSPVKDSITYALRYSNSESSDGKLSHEVGIPALRRVVSEELTQKHKSADAADTLRDVLGVPATMPEWVEREIEEIANEFRGGVLTGDSLTSLRKKLSDLGYSEYLPDVLGRVIE